MPLSPLVRRLLAPNPSPFTYQGTQSYLVGEADLAIIDPGPADEAHIAALMVAIGDRPVLAILCTHTHRDHSPATRPLAALTCAPIIGCAPLSLDDDGPRADAAFDADYVPDRVLGDGERVTGTGWTLTAVATPGHTSNHLCFALEEEGALFTGDHVMGWSTSVVIPPDGSMAAYLDSLRAIRARGFQTLWPTHGPPVTDTAPFLDAYIAHRLEREAQILAAVRGGVDRIAAMVDKLYADLDPRLKPAAAQSVYSHLIKLTAEGQVRSDPAPQLSSVYRPQSEIRSN